MRVERGREGNEQTRKHGREEKSMTIFNCHYTSTSFPILISCPHNKKPRQNKQSNQVMRNVPLIT
jgi:hypothetical protein